MNGKNSIKNKNNRRNYDELKYKVIVDGNINNGNIGGNEQILINDGNLIKNMKDKKYNDDINYDALSRNPIDLEAIENNDINDKNNIEINPIKQGNTKCISRFKRGNKAPEINLTCNEEINYDIIEERKIDESNSKDTKEFMNEKNLIKLEETNKY